MIKINQRKAIELAKKLVRDWRTKEFASNDIVLQNAVADGDEVAKREAIERRDWLRSLPSQCEGKSVDELKALLIEIGAINGQA